MSETAAFSEPPRDPLARTFLREPENEDCQPGVTLAQMDEGFPFVNLPAYERVQTGAASQIDGVKTAVWRAASVATVALDRVERLHRQLSEIRADRSRTELGKQALAVPFIDAIRTEFDKDLAHRVIDAGEMARKLDSRIPFDPRDPDGRRSDEIKRALERMSDDARDDYLHSVLSEGINGDPDALETIRSVILATKAWQHVLPRWFVSERRMLLRVLAPDVVHAVGWLEWAAMIGETALNDLGRWLDAQRSSFNAPVQRATLQLPDNGL